MEIKKQKQLDNLKETILSVQSKIDKEKDRIKELTSKTAGEIKSLKLEDQVLYANLKAQSAERVEELDRLHASPFFVKLEMEIGSNKTKKSFYLAKHHFTEENIYSWIAPIASVRFEKPGPVEYQIPGGTKEKAILNNKEQYLIVNGKVVFFAQESTDTPRELIYQEHFSAKKEGFILPEIVAVMEKAQDTVIRAHHKGPFVISGPAGSGKTTLALHRVAYLAQSPDTSHIYTEDSIVVFVQDNGTKEYFSHLLPELGIHKVHITTFYEWAITLLGLSDVKYVTRRGKDENDMNEKEFERQNMLTLHNIPSWTETKKFLKKHGSTGIDRIDLTLALASYYAHHKKFEIKTSYTTVDKQGEFVQKIRKTVPNYSLLVIDEFQNYMPEQLKLINHCVNEETHSIVYVGDMAQQVLSGTIRSWESIGHTMNAEREVRLHKVYRNTRQILEYIQDLEYKIEIPDGIKEGAHVKEHFMTEQSKILECIQNIIDSSKGLVGVIAYNKEYLSFIRDHFKDKKRVHVITMAESQGVEFDTVCIVGITENLFSTKNLEVFPQSFIDEKKKIQKDLLYVALTRAISELHIIGECSLKKALNT